MPRGAAGAAPPAPVLGYRRGRVPAPFKSCGPGRDAPPGRGEEGGRDRGKRGALAGHLGAGCLGGREQEPCREPGAERSRPSPPCPASPPLPPPARGRPGGSERAAPGGSGANSPALICCLIGLYQANNRRAPAASSRGRGRGRRPLLLLLLLLRGAGAARSPALAPPPPPAICRRARPRAGPTPR